jgi:hypothetical protein
VLPLRRMMAQFVNLVLHNVLRRAVMQGHPNLTEVRFVAVGILDALLEHPANRFGFSGDFSVDQDLSRATAEFRLQPPEQLALIIGEGFIRLSEVEETGCRGAHPTATAAYVACFIMFCV